MPCSVEEVKPGSQAAQVWTQVQGDGRQANQKQPQGSAQPAPVINPVGASSNYTNSSLSPVDGTSTHAQHGTVAAPSSANAEAHKVYGGSVDLAKPGDAATAADDPAVVSNTSRLDKPGLSDPLENQLPGYQARMCCLFPSHHHHHHHHVFLVIIIRFSESSTSTSLSHHQVLLVIIISFLF